MSEITDKMKKILEKANDNLSLTQKAEIDLILKILEDQLYYWSYDRYEGIGIEDEIIINEDKHYFLISQIKKWAIKNDLIFRRQKFIDIENKNRYFFYLSFKKHTTVKLINLKKLYCEYLNKNKKSVKNEF